MKILVSALLLISLFAGRAAHAVQMPIDVEKSKIEFTADALFENVSGAFTKWSGSIDYDKTDPLKSSVSVEIDTGSLDTSNKSRDKHLRNEDFFNILGFPTATFKSTGLSPVANQANLYDVVGNFTLLGVTKEITFPVEIREEGGRIVARANFSINRQDYGMNYRAYLNPIKDLVGVRLAVETR